MSRFHSRQLSGITPETDPKSHRALSLFAQVFERATADSAASTLAAVESFLGGGIAPPSSSSSSSYASTIGSAADSAGGDSASAATVTFANHGGVGPAALAVGRSGSDPSSHAGAAAVTAAWLPRSLVLSERAIVLCEEFFAAPNHQVRVRGGHTHIVPHPGFSDRRSLT
jgi:hypothetical protein